VSEQLPAARVVLKPAAVLLGVGLLLVVVAVLTTPSEN
jgi:hypothetical protein